MTKYRNSSKFTVAERVLIFIFGRLAESAWLLFYVFGTICVATFVIAAAAWNYFTQVGKMTQMTAFEGWAMLELMGHRQRIGFVKEVEMAGGKMLRIDIPNEGRDITEFYGCAAIYSLRPVAEGVAREAMKRHGDIRPIRSAEYRALAAPTNGEHREDFDDDELPL
jgi:hypothetical protein